MAFPWKCRMLGWLRRIQCRRVRTFALLSLLGTALVAPPLFSQTAAPTEYQVKAAYLLNFTRFITWPEGSFGAADEPFQITILGQDPFDSDIEEAVKGKTVGDRELRVTRISDLKDLGPCHILFICSSEKSRLSLIINQLGNRPILTVGESNRFTGAGGIIQFIEKSRKIRFKINTDAAERGNFMISSKLLKLATIHRE